MDNRHLLLRQEPRQMPVNRQLYRQQNIGVTVLRLDELHSTISGNKWYKLKAYVEQAAAENKEGIITFGGAYSNHILATAAACAESKLKSVGIIRGEAPRPLNATLQDAQALGMRLFFNSRAAYREKQIPAATTDELKLPDWLVVPEGGYGARGARGSMDILKTVHLPAFTHIVAAVGTGTMLAGLVAAALPGQTVLGISALKNNVGAETAVHALLPSQQMAFQINHDFHFGGYAKYTPELGAYMNQFHRETGVATDFVYTAKTFFAVEDLAAQGFFAVKSSLLVIHSGGLQGNRSLPPGTLRF